MSNTVIQVENLSKRYQLGTIGYGSLQHDLRAWWAKARGKEDPNAKIGEKSRLDLHGDFWALRNVGFEVEKGDRVGIIGRNGAGKSTLLKLLSRVTSPTTGAIRVRGRVASLLEVGTGFHPELTGRENVFLNGAILGMKRREIQAKFDEIVGFAGVEQFIDTPVKRYSSGMYVRLAFSVAAHLDSEILIIDEVLAVGDAEFQKKCLGKMEDVSVNQGRTILFVSHNISAIKNLCNRALYLESGGIKQAGGIDQIVTRYSADGRANASKDISLRKDRIGVQNIRFSRLWLENEQRERLTQVKTGQHLFFCFELLSNTSFKGALEISLVLHNESGDALINLSNQFEGIALNVAGRERAVFQCEVDSLPLNEGLYTISAYASDGVETQDWVQNAYEVAVVFEDYFNTGFKPNSVWPFIVRSRWS